MAWIDLLARKFAEVLKSEDFKFETMELYTNQYGRIGLRYSVRVNNRTFYISHSPISRKFAPQEVARIILEADNIDRTKSPVYRNQYFGPGLRIEARSCGRWFEVWTPMTGQPEGDSFSKFAADHAKKSS